MTLKKFVKLCSVVFIQLSIQYKDQIKGQIICLLKHVHIVCNILLAMYSICVIILNFEILFLIIH